MGLGLRILRNRVDRLQLQAFRGFELWIVL